MFSAAQRAVARTPSETPQSILGSALVCHYDGDVGLTFTGGVISGWADQGRRGNHLSQSTAGRRPSFSAAALHGHGAVSFGGAHQLLTTTLTGLVAGNRPHVYCVAQYQGSEPTTTQGLFSAEVSTASVNTGIEIYHDTSTLVGQATMAATRSAGWNDDDFGQWLLYEVLITSGDVVQLKTKNTVHASSAASSGGLASTLQALGLGCFANFSFFPGNVKIASFVLTNSIPTTDQHSRVLTYLHTRYPSIVIS